jgi:hypothetical protein
MKIATLIVRILLGPLFPLVPFADGAGRSADDSVRNRALGNPILRSAPGVCRRIHAAGSGLN